KLKSTLEDAMKKLDDIEDQEPGQTREVQEGVVVGFLDEYSPQSCANTVRVYSFWQGDKREGHDKV
ncbi:MAG: hypothetical protein ACUVTL_10420, partial [Thermoproteota archaeon]